MGFETALLRIPNVRRTLSTNYFPKGCVGLHSVSSWQGIKPQSGWGEWEKGEEVMHLAIRRYRLAPDSVDAVMLQVNEGFVFLIRMPIGLLGLLRLERWLR